MLRNCTCRRAGHGFLPRTALHARLLASLHASSRPAVTAPGLQAEPWTNSTEQQTALRQLQQRLSSSPAKVPDDDTLKWYLRDRYFDVAEAEVKLRSMMRWRAEFQPDAVTMSQVEREYASGKAYVHTHSDIYGRPVIVIRTQRHKTGEYPIVDSKRLATFLIDEAIRKLPSNGEQIIGVFDLRGFGLSNADFEFARFMVEAFFEYYPRRVGQVLFVEAPWVFQPAWEVVKPLLKKYKALVRFVTVPEIRAEFFTPQTVPPDFR